MHSPPTIVRHIVRPKSAEPPRSPLLKRVQSEEKLSPSYGSDKKHLCSRKHSLEVTQEEVQREQSQREVTLQSLEENVCDAPALSRARPVEQGCLKRPVSRKLGRQESVDELDREKLKAKVVVKKPDGLPEKQESRHKPHGLGNDVENLSAFRLEEREKKIYPKASERSNHFENKAAVQEAQALGSLLKDALHKHASVRASEAVPSGGAAAPGDHSQGTGDLKRASAHSTLQDGLCHATHRATSGKGDYTEKAPQAKEGPRCEKLDSKLANIDYLRKKMSLEDKDDGLCPVLKPKMTPGAQEGMPGNAGRPAGGQQEAQPASESRTPFISGHVAQLSTVSFVPLKALSGRVDSGAEKPGLAAPESPVRKSPSEYKLEGRSVSCLKPIEGTLDIALLSGPQASKTELPSPEPAQSPSPGSDVGPPVPQAPAGSVGRKGETAGQRESSPASFKVNKSYLLEPRFPPPSRGLQGSPAAPLPDAELKLDRKISHAARTPATIVESHPQRGEGSPSRQQDHSPDVRLLPLLGQSLQGAEPSRVHSPLPPEGAPLREKPSGRESSERAPSTARSERSALRADIRRDPSKELYPLEAAKTSDNSKTLPAVGRTHPDVSTQTQALEKACGPCGRANPKDGRDEVRPLAREEPALRSAAAPCERELGKGRSGPESKPASAPARWPLEPRGTESGKSEKLSSFRSVQKDGPKEPERKEQPLQKHLTSSSQPLPTTKELPGLAAQQHYIQQSYPAGSLPGSKPCATDSSLGLQDPPKPAAVLCESSSRKPRSGPDTDPPKSKHPDRPLSSQKLSVEAAVGKQPGAQPPGKEGKGSSKGVSEEFPALPGPQNTARDVTGQGASGPSVPLHTEWGPLDTKLRPTSSGHPPEALEKPAHPPRQGPPGVSESVDQKLPTVGERQHPSSKAPKPSTVKDYPPLCKQTDRSLSPLAASADAGKSEGKKCTEALYSPVDSGKPGASLSPAQGEAGPKGTERPAAAAGKGWPEAKGKGPGFQKPLTEADKPSGMKRSPSATAQSSFRCAALPEKSLSYSSGFPEARSVAPETSTTCSDIFSAKAGRATAEPPASSSKDHRKPLPGGDGRTQMTKSDSLPSFRSSAITLESYHPNPGVGEGASHRDRALSGTATAGETKGKEPAPAQPAQTRKQNVCREVTKPFPAPSTERPIALPSEKDSGVRQRRGKESLRGSPHKKAL